MATVIHRVTKQISYSVDTPFYSVADYIIDPDLSAVTGFDSKYFIITGDIVTLMDQAARDVVDAEELAQAILDDKIFEKTRIDDERILTAFALVVMNEINTLRAQHGLADRTIEQLKNAIKNEVDNG